jgi:hypothetical protein
MVLKGLKGIGLVYEKRELAGWLGKQYHLEGFAAALLDQPNLMLLTDSGNLVQFVLPQ